MYFKQFIDCKSPSPYKFERCLSLCMRERERRKEGKEERRNKDSRIVPEIENV